MKHVVEGIYSEGKITISENVPIKGNSKVLIVFLDDPKGNNDKKEQLLKTFGSWDDSRPAEDIIKDIYSSRTSRKKDIIL